MRAHQAAPGRVAPSGAGLLITDTFGWALAFEVAKAEGVTNWAAGSDFVSRVMTAHATLRQQGRNVLGFVRAALEAQLRGTTPPSLLPPADAA